MAARNTGFALIAASSVQEVLDYGIASQLATLKSRIPFLVFFDGFRTSHDVAKVDLVSYETMAKLVEPKYIEDFRARAMKPEKPYAKVGAQTLTSTSRAARRRTSTTTPCRESSGNTSRRSVP